MNISRPAPFAAVLLSVAYTAGICAGKTAAHLDEDDEPKIYMDHTHGGED